MKATEREKKILCLLIQGMSDKELIDAIAASAKLTKADAGRIMMVLRVYEGMPSKIDAARIIDVLFGMKKAELIDAISAGAKLTKADAGRGLDITIELFRMKLKRDLEGRK